MNIIMKLCNEYPHYQFGISTSSKGITLFLNNNIDKTNITEMSIYFDSLPQENMDEYIEKKFLELIKRS